ncbi:hypothetical protein [Pseudomonas citronellolis]|uniref:hypothetical protein n=1 Tax=Pseudomonas citronellolis TaxID=53408 RepID=UPI000852D181|nr:hypothetical protein [Pseudomonas humi]
MSYQAGQPVLWPVPADWADGVRETLEWLSDVLPARNRKTQKRQLRQVPRRSFTFDIIADEQLARVADTLLNDRGSQSWLLPIWHDVQLLSAALPIDSPSVPCRTAGFDFVLGGQAVLWNGVNQWEVVGIVAIEDNELVLGDTTSSAWPAGTRLYPLRRGYLVEQPQETRWTDDKGTRSVQFILDEPCAWPAVLPVTTYRGYPVLEERPDWGEDLGMAFARSVESVDVGTGPITRIDWPGRAFREAQVTWIASGREHNTALRSLLYALRGRMQTIWLPTWNTDLVLIASIGATATSMTVQWCGYTLYGRAQSNWRDIRIELWSGVVFYRRITGAVQAGANEVLQLDAALGIAVTPSQVRTISFLVLSEQATDAVELVHVTDADGITSVSTKFQGVRNDV